MGVVINANVTIFSGSAPALNQVMIALYFFLKSLGSFLLHNVLVKLYVEPGNECNVLLSKVSWLFPLHAFYFYK